VTANEPGPCVSDHAARRILLAEDDAPLRELIATALRADGYEVVEAGDGLELLAHVESALSAKDHGFDAWVIVADINMPGLTGLDVLAILRCAAVDAPVLLMTAFGDKETRLEAAELGAAAILDKPFDLECLRTALARVAAVS